MYRSSGSGVYNPLEQWFGNRRWPLNVVVLVPVTPSQSIRALLYLWTSYRPDRTPMGSSHNMRALLLNAAERQLVAQSCSAKEPQQRAWGNAELLTLWALNYWVSGPRMHCRVSKPLPTCQKIMVLHRTVIKKYRPRLPLARDLPIYQVL